MINKGLFTSDKNYWETPRSFYNELDKEFHFTLDPCSTHENAKCTKHYTEEDDGLSKSWAGEVVFCNPPYGREIKYWVAKCHEEAKHATIVMLIPARTDTSYFHEHIYHDADEIRFLRGRLKFELNGIPGDSAPFPSMVVIYNNKTQDSTNTSL